MLINDDKRVIVFLDEVENQICTYIERNSERFPSCNNLLRKFRERFTYWKSKNEMSKEIIEIVNELCVAKLILESTVNSCKRLEYEPKSQYTDKSIDFYIELENSLSVYCDVKTIHPDRIDKWDKFEDVIGKDHIPKNINIDIDKDLGGGVFWHEWVAARSKMLTHVMGLEEKLRSMRINDAVTVMMYCSNGIQLQLDLLEDFSDFYKNGRYRSDDMFSIMEHHFIQSKGIILDRTINYISYVERKELDIQPKQFIPKVEGPRNFY